MNTIMYNHFLIPNGLSVINSGMQTLNIHESTTCSMYYASCKDKIVLEEHLVMNSILFTQALRCS